MARKDVNNRKLWEHILRCYKWQAETLEDLQNLLKKRCGRHGRGGTIVVEGLQTPLRQHLGVLKVLHN